MSYINIAQIIKDSDSKFLRGLPNFVFGVVAVIFRQDDLNKLFSDTSEYSGVEFPPKVIEYLNVKVEVEGKENLPDNGKCFFVSNHPFGFIDGLIQACIVGDKYGDLRIIGNDSLKYVPHLNPILTNVNVFGQNSRHYIAELEKLYASDIPITTFPAGIVSRIKKRKIQDIEWKKSFIKKAVANKRDVIPILFKGRNSILFYAIFIFRQIFNIKATIELSLLPWEMFRKRNSTIKVRIGEPISYKSFNRTLSHTEWAQKVRNDVYNIK